MRNTCFGIARRVYAGQVRRAQKERDAQERSGVPSPAQEMPAFARGEGILQDLAQDDRFLVLARGVWRQPFAQISHELGRTENWARVRYFRLISRLREDLQREGERDGRP